MDSTDNIKLNLLEKDNHYNNNGNEVKILTSFNGSNLLNSAIPKNIENKNGHSYSNNNEENILNFNSIQNQIDTNIIQDINLKYFRQKILKKKEKYLKLEKEIKI